MNFRRGEKSCGESTPTTPWEGGEWRGWRSRSRAFFPPHEHFIFLLFDSAFILLTLNRNQSQKGECERRETTRHGIIQNTFQQFPFNSFAFFLLFLLLLPRVKSFLLAKSAFNVKQLGKDFPTDDEGAEISLCCLTCLFFIFFRAHPLNELSSSRRWKCDEFNFISTTLNETFPRHKRCK